MSRGEADHVVPPVDERWAGEFAKFIETGDASDEFFAYLDENEACQKAVDLALKKKSQGLDRVAQLLNAEAPATARVRNDPATAGAKDESSPAPRVKIEQWSAALAQALIVAARLPADQRSRVVRDAVAQAGRSRREKQAVKAMAAELVEETADNKS